MSMTARCRHALRSSGGSIATTLVWLVSEVTEKTNRPVGTFDVTSGIWHRHPWLDAPCQTAFRESCLMHSRGDVAGKLR
jgi:hypothetical protein